MTVRIAGVHATIMTAFAQNVDAFRRYSTQSVCPDAPVFGVTAREISDGRLVYSERFKEDCPQLSDPVIERVLLLEKFAEHAISKDVLLIHGSAICMDGRGYLFMAPSGTGKSTHTRLWRRAFGDRCFMVNDDKPFLCVNQDDVMVSGSPWNGKHRLDTNVSVPLHAIVILNRDETNRIAGISPEAAFRCLYQQVYHPAQKAAQIKALQLLSRVCHHVAFYELHCNMQEDAATVSYHGMQ